MDIETMKKEVSLLGYMNGSGYQVNKTGGRFPCLA